MCFEHFVGNVVGKLLRCCSPITGRKEKGRKVIGTSSFPSWMCFVYTEWLKIKLPLNTKEKIHRFFIKSIIRLFTQVTYQNIIEKSLYITVCFGFAFFRFLMWGTKSIWVCFHKGPPGGSRIERAPNNYIRVETDDGPQTGDEESNFVHTESGEHSTDVLPKKSRTIRYNQWSFKLLEKIKQRSTIR